MILSRLLGREEGEEGDKFMPCCFKCSGWSERQRTDNTKEFAYWAKIVLFQILTLTQEVKILL